VFKGEDSYRSRSVRDSKNSLLVLEEFFDAKKLRALQGAKINFPQSGIEQIFA